MIKAVIFDLDGVLVDSEKFSVEASSRTLKEYGIEQTPEERENAFGRTDLESFRGYINSRGLGLDPEEMVKRKVRIYSRLIRGKLKPMPGARELLEGLRRKGIRIAIASSGTPEKIGATLGEINMQGLFDVMVTARDIERGKPHPEIFLKAAEKLGVKPENCLVVEDAQAGVEAAKRAGMRCVALKSPGTFGQDLSKADRIINSLKEVEP